ncbi:hypothetical protein SAMN05444339_101754 [Loktanella atrilutea]|uniref:Yip1 domain-containing protein n=1 Tax=Loktanella atrilutea TaxID=366533 RepID=A0A1M4UJ86_LOKAT|nr:YIP1 family protein [Loktanella atrilutea]SHE56842.1 hypothetical protein SAMN05444339_101754 [Loktanella atrilutea]
MTPGAFIGGSFRDPAGTARALTRTALPGGVLWQMAALVTVASVLVLQLGLFLSPAEAAMVGASPFMLCVILGSSLLMMIAAIYWTGRMIGGQGAFAAAILLVVWWQAMALVIQIVQTLALLLFPPLAGIVTLAGLAWLVFALLHLVNVLHGFDSLLKSLGTVVIGVLGISFGLALLLALIGVTLQGGTL